MPPQVITCAVLHYCDTEMANNQVRIDVHVIFIRYVSKQLINDLHETKLKKIAVSKVTFSRRH